MTPPSDTTLGALVALHVGSVARADEPVTVHSLAALQVDLALHGPAPRS